MTVTGWLAAAGWAVAAVAAALATGVRLRLGRLRRAVAVTEHELRGPLAAVRLGVELALGRGRMGAADLRATATELARTEPALLDLTIARTGRSPGSARRRAPGGGRFGLRRGAHPAPTAMAIVDLAELVRDSVRAWGPSAEAAGVALELDPPVGGGRVPGDRARLAQATGNLIANAISHGGGRVRVGAGVDSGRARVWVRDDGGGLPSGAVERANRRSRRCGPHGHGLAVVAAVAQLHGGELSAPAAGPGGVVLALPAARQD